MGDRLGRGRAYTSGHGPGADGYCAGKFAHRVGDDGRSGSGGCDIR